LQIYVFKTNFKLFYKKKRAFLKYFFSRIRGNKKTLIEMRVKDF